MPGFAEYRQMPVADALPLSPEKAMVMWDFMFFANYAAGWIVTLSVNPQFVYDNNLTRMFKVYNICIGTDSWPYRPVALLVFIMATPLLAFVSAAHWLKISVGLGGYKWARKGLLVVSFFLIMTFSITYGTPPFDYITSVMHTGMFATGLLGYALNKLGSIIEFFVWDGRGGFYDEDHNGIMDASAKIYIITQIVHTAVMFVGSGILLHSLATNDYSTVVANIDGNTGNVVGGLQVVGSVDRWWPHAYVVEQDGTGTLLQFDYCGNFLVLASFLAPIIQAATVPASIKNEVAVSAFKPVGSPGSAPEGICNVVGGGAKAVVPPRGFRFGGLPVCAP